MGCLADRLGGYTNLVRLAPDGRVECSARSVEGSAEARRSRDWFQRLAGGERFVLARSQRTADPELVAAQRIEGAGGVFDGALVARALPGKTLTIRDTTVRNASWERVASTDAENPNIAIRGYIIRRNETDERVTQ